MGSLEADVFVPRRAKILSQAGVRIPDSQRCRPKIRHLEGTFHSKASMGYRNLQQAVADLERHGQLRRIPIEVDPRLEAGMIQRRVWAAGGPALLFERVRGTRFPLLANLFGTADRARFLFRDRLAAVRRLVELKADPAAALKHPFRAAGLLPVAWSMLPKRVRSGPVHAETVSLSELPAVTSWPRDGGPFVTLPQVYSEDPAAPGLMKSNLGMYRVQLAGNEFLRDREVGLHYQIHRSIGVHHARAIALGQRLPVNIFVGGTPAMTLAAVMPLPEGLSELMFAGALAGHRIPMIANPHGASVYAEADFCIQGTIDPHLTKPEGPFGDHLGYYSLAHEFPFLQVERVTARPGAIWPFTTVGRPPQEDTTFGQIIHEITGPVIPAVLPGVRAIHAVDEAGVHPLLLAIGSERYVPYGSHRTPQELLTLAHAILGQGQLSLAKYLLIVAGEDDPALDIHDIGQFLRHLLARVDWRRDLHFSTATTIDTLDYSGAGFNAGSKLVIAAAGPPVRELPLELTSALLPAGFHSPAVAAPGVLAIQGPPSPATRGGEADDVRQFCEAIPVDHPWNRFPLWVIVDDSRFTAETLRNLLWVTFTRSNPAADVHGVGATTVAKHWGCRGALVIDARSKTWMAPALEEDPVVVQRVEQIAAGNGPLAGLF